MTVILILIVLVVLGGAITLIVIGMRETRGDDPLQENSQNTQCGDNLPHSKRLSSLNPSPNG